MKTCRTHSSVAFVTTLLLSAVLAACGGGGSGGDTNPPPPSLAITAQPVDQSVVAGGIARFTVQATGNGLTYQWQLSTDAGASWSDVSGASGSTLEVSGVTTNQDKNQYRAKVSNGSSTVTTSAVTLKVSTAVVAPKIDVDVPASFSATVGGAASISVTASGTSVGYQWQRSTDGGSSWANISGETAATLNLSALAQETNGWRFRVVVSNSAGTVTSGVTTLQVSAAPVLTIKTGPTSVEVVEPTAATFTVVVVGQPEPTYQWQRSTDGGTSYTDISGATGASYTTDATNVSGTGARYRVKVTNSAGSVTSDAAVLTVKAGSGSVAPTVQTQPISMTVLSGVEVTFTVAATGTPTPTIQWQVSTDGGLNYANITGATAVSYRTNAVSVSDSGKRFRAVVTNSVGSVNSNAATLIVNGSTTSSYFTKISADGKDLPDAATNWECVRYNKTGMLWEANINRDVGSDGRLIGHACSWDTTRICTGFSNLGNGHQWDASSVPAAVTNKCGRTGWRLPTIDEANEVLFNYKDYLKWFGQDDKTPAGWTSTIDSNDPTKAWVIGYDGTIFDITWPRASSAIAVRLVSP